MSADAQALDVDPIERATKTGAWATHGSFAAVVVMLLASDGPMQLAIKVLPQGTLAALSFMAFLITLVVSVIGLLRRRGGLAVLFTQPGLLIFVLCAWATVTILWSINPRHTLTGILFLIANALGSAYVARDGLPRALNILFNTGLFLMVASVLTVLLTPDVGLMRGEYEGAWRGLWLEKNQLGSAAAITGLLALSLWGMGEKRWLSTFAFLLCCVVLVKSQSVTSLFAFVAGAGSIVVAFMLRRGPILATLVLAGGTVVVLGALLAGPTLWDQILASVGRNSTLTSRTAIWHAVEAFSQEHMVLGYGYIAYFSVPEGPMGYVIEVLDFRPYTAHNSWLQTRVDLGYPGLAMTVLLLAMSVYYSFARLIAQPAAAAAIAVLVSSTLISLVEVVFAAPGGLVWIGLTALIMAAAVEARYR
jgi:O-antigen ligase